MSKIDTDVSNILPSFSGSAPESGIADYFAGNMSNYSGHTWAEGIDTAMAVIFNNYTTIYNYLNDSQKADLKAYLIRIYMNKTLQSGNEAALKTKLGTDVKPDDTTTLSMLPPEVLQELAASRERIG
jgi:hypothetical protein